MALDKTDNEHIAKELTRIIYTLTSKESSQGRGWCSLICNCDGLRILIKMLDATVEFVVTLSGNFRRLDFDQKNSTRIKMSRLSNLYSQYFDEIEYK